MKQIFINLPVNDVEKSMQLYLALGFTANPLFTDEQQKCVIWSDAIYLMIQTKEFSNSYLKKTNTDTNQILTSSHTLPVESIKKVDEILDKALKAGANEPVAPLKEDFMYLRTIEDLDGYLWGIMYIDLAKFKIVKQKI